MTPIPGSCNDHCHRCTQTKESALKLWSEAALKDKEKHKQKDKHKHKHKHKHKDKHKHKHKREHKANDKDKEPPRIQGCIFCLMCSYPELTDDHVLTSA